METISELIDRLGGTSAVAAGMKLTPSTVSSWKTSGRIPGWRRPGLTDFAAAAGMSITDEEISAAERASAAKDDPAPAEQAAA